MAVHPYALYYSQHVRMYCLLMLAGLLSTWRFERYLDRPTVRNLAILSVANLFLGYTQYYGWCLVLLEFVYLLWKSERRNAIAFLFATVPVAILFAPWALLAARVLHARGLAQNLGWISRPTFGDLNWFWVDLTGFAEFRGDGASHALAVLIPFVLCYRRYGEPRVPLADAVVDHARADRVRGVAMAAAIHLGAPPITIWNLAVRAAILRRCFADASPGFHRSDGRRRRLGRARGRIPRHR